MDNKFGMFIHWGIYALTGLHEQALARFDLSKEYYENLMYSFNPTKYDPNKWVELAKDAGMKYICITAKHHDGFCMWDTKQTDYNIMHTPYGRDVIKVLSEACARHEMLLSFYYSCPDWHEKTAYNMRSSHQWKAYKDEADDQKYREFVKAQITELLTNYGKIYTLFWDIPPRIEDRSINELVRKLQPGILINNRGYDEGDFATPERYVPEGVRFEKMTEACQSVGEQSWGYRKDEDYYSARFLMSSIDKIMAMGGSYLLNVGPDADGEIPEKAQALLRRIGKWYNHVSVALENTLPTVGNISVTNNCPLIAVSKCGKTYLHFYNGINSGAVTFTDCSFKPKHAKLLNDGRELIIRNEELPEFFDFVSGKVKGSLVSMTGIPVDELCEEPVVIEIE